VLVRYSGPFISQLLTISATAALLSYTLYTIEAENLPDDNSMLFTLPLVAIGLFRYLYLLNRSSEAEAPEHLIVRDLPLLATVVAWLAVSAAVLLLSG
jgi:4-hydroxybenzoate polyprenyltransferase